MKKQVQEIYEEFESKKALYGKVDEKTSQLLKILYPNGIKKEQYNDGLFILHILEKLCRISSAGISEERKLDAKRDVAGYAVLSIEKELRGK